ncbi:MAG TPA: 5-methyltetrahydropteroyltriglutamate--homocysteine S-methyltransferase [Burkholderiales bacterium]|nr:5-methyltetrahydropteroyltriglutamate--homocysteine S-methyltransferase [Burkholderiales bacterium]
MILNMTARPPFRADQVGSLLRPLEIKEARARVERGELSADDLRVIEDRCIERAVARQESIGLRSITDGEYRRGWWNHDFLGKIGGVEIELDRKSYKFAGSDDPRYTPQVRRKVRRVRPMMLDHFRYLKSVAKGTPKFTMPSPSILYHRGGRAAISRDAYPDLEELWRDVGQVYREEIRDLAAAGCTYLQIDDTSFSFLCDEKFRDSCRARGDDPEALPHMYARAVNAAIAGRPPGMTIAMHTCRGNWKSTWLAAGGYEPVARAVFQETEVDAYFLEYDSERAGSFEPLRMVPKGKKVVLGLVSTKTPVLEKKDGLKRRIGEAARLVPLEQLCLSPQCGFASTHHGNLLTEDEQWKKLELVVETARETWGE